MESAGASKEEIEEMMSMIMNKGGGISQGCSSIDTLSVPSHV